MLTESEFKENILSNIFGECNMTGSGVVSLKGCYWAFSTLMLQIHDQQSRMRQWLWHISLIALDNKKKRKEKQATEDGLIQNYFKKLERKDSCNWL